MDMAEQFVKASANHPEAELAILLLFAPYKSIEWVQLPSSLPHAGGVHATVERKSTLGIKDDIHEAILVELQIWQNNGVGFNR